MEKVLYVFLLISVKHSMWKECWTVRDVFNTLQKLG